MSTSSGAENGNWANDLAVPPRWPVQDPGRAILDKGTAGSRCSLLHWHLLKKVCKRVNYVGLCLMPSFCNDRRGLFI